MKPPIKSGSPFDYQTPPEALDPLYAFLKPKCTIWECASGEGNLLHELTNRGYNVIGSDIITGHDFLMYEPEHKYDVIITNPPYDLKKEFLERAYSLGKPFAFLLPTSTFDTPRRQELFRQYGIEVIMFDKRIDFTPPTGISTWAKRSWFSVAWFTNGLKIGKQLTFVKYKKVQSIS